MLSVFWAALGIGGSTLIGTGCGFWISHISEPWNDAVTAFAAGVMLSAAAFGLFVPAMEMVQGAGCLLIPLGTALGMLFLRGTAAVSGHLRGGGVLLQHPELMFVLAIALHKFPEGMAGGVGLGGVDCGAARMVALGIALQNLPEGAVMIPPLLSAGVRRSRAACIALATGLLNAAGVVAGALWGHLSGSLLPLALCFAGGAMLDVIVSQMIPQVVCAGRLKQGPQIVLGGFAIMAVAAALF